MHADGRRSRLGLTAGFVLRWLLEQLRTGISDRLLHAFIPISRPIGDQFGRRVLHTKRKWLGCAGLTMRRAGLEPAPPD